jgi:hypothetical protein
VVANHFFKSAKYLWCRHCGERSVDGKKHGPRCPAGLLEVAAKKQKQMDERHNPTNSSRKG